METIQGKEVQKLKLNVTNINSFLKKSSKDYTKVKKNNKRLVSDQNKRKKTKEKEKTIEKKSVGGSALSNVKDVAKSSAGIFDNILSFGGILLSGILLNALPSIKKKVTEAEYWDATYGDTHDPSTGLPLGVDKLLED